MLSVGGTKGGARGGGACKCFLQTIGCGKIRMSAPNFFGMTETGLYEFLKDKGMKEDDAQMLRSKLSISR